MVIKSIYKVPKAIIILAVASTIMGLNPLVQAQPSPTPNAPTNSAPQQSTEELYKKGIEQINADNYQGAIVTFNQVLKQNPDDVSALYNRGLAYTLLEEYQKAIADFTEVLELDPEDPDAYENRALARTQIEDYQGAIADYTQLLRRKPDNAEAFYNRGLSRAQLEDYDAAIMDLKKAAELYTAQGQSEQAKQAKSIAESLSQ